MSDDSYTLSETNMYNDLDGSAKMRREMIAVLRDNKKLKLQLKSNNETLNSLITKNFADLENLKSNFDKLSQKYKEQIETLSSQYDFFQKTFRHRMKSYQKTTVEVYEKKIGTIEAFSRELGEKLKEMTDKEERLLSEERELVEKINLLERTKTSLSEEIEDKIGQISQLQGQKESWQKNYSLLEGKCNDLTEKWKIEKQSVAVGLEQIRELRNKIDSILREKNNTEGQLAELQKQYQSLKIEMLSLSEENFKKQTSLDSKNMENLELQSNKNELHRKLESIDKEKKMLEYQIEKDIEKIRNLDKNLTEIGNSNRAFETKLEFLENELERWKTEYGKIRNEFLLKERELREKQESLEKKNLETIQQIKKEYEEKIADLGKERDDETQKLKVELSTLRDKSENTIKLLEMHIKSFTDTHYHIFEENEKIKNQLMTIKKENDSFQLIRQADKEESRKEIDAWKQSYQKEKELHEKTRLEYEDKLKETTENLQGKINQTLEALNLTKTTIYNLKESNSALEKKLQSSTIDVPMYQKSLKELKEENSSLKEKLEKSVELNNLFNNKEKQYENQIKQLSAKYNSLNIPKK